LKLQQTAGVKFFGAPKVVTLNGETATVSVTRAAWMNGSYTNVGVTIELKPSVSAAPSPAIKINFTANVSELVDDSPQQDGSGRKVRTTTATASEQMASGQTLLIRQAISDGEAFGEKLAEPTSLLVFVTPSLLTDKQLQPMSRPRKAQTSP
jgi:hypothetical protein